MGETFKAFIAFISEDPIMLGLCIAIVVLIIMFILVLILGKKKDKKMEVSDNTNDELLKAEIDMDALKSTNEYKLDELNNALSNKTLELEEEKKNTEEIPVTTEEPVKVEIEDKWNSEEPIDSKSDHEEDIPKEEYPTFDNIQVTTNREETYEEDKTEEIPSGMSDTSVIESTSVPVEEDNINTSLNIETLDALENEIDTSNVLESSSNPIENENITEITLEPVEEEVFPILTEESLLPQDTKDREEIKENTSQLDISNITLEEDVLSTIPPVEEVISPVKESLDKNDETSIDENIETTKAKNEEIIEEIPEKTEEPIEESQNQEVNNDTSEVELPTMTDNKEEIETPDYSDIYSIDDIELPIINFDEFNKKEDKQQETTEGDEDLDLPKLNSNPISTKDFLQGESFKIK